MSESKRSSRGTRLPLRAGPAVLAAVIAIAWSAGWTNADPGQELPEGVTAALISQGDSVYHGAGFCYTCHGPDGSGIPQLGSDLTDDEWEHADGSYEGIVNRVTSGVTAEESTTGVPMPPKGGARLSDDQVRAVAAYVWTLNRGS